MTEAWGIKSRIVSKEATLWKCPYFSMRILFIRFFKVSHKNENRTTRDGFVE